MKAVDWSFIALFVLALLPHAWLVVAFGMGMANFSTLHTSSYWTWYLLIISIVNIPLMLGVLGVKMGATKVSREIFYLFSAGFTFVAMWFTFTVIARSIMFGLDLAANGWDMYNSTFQLISAIVELVLFFIAVTFAVLCYMYAHGTFLPMYHRYKRDGGGVRGLRGAWQRDQ